MAELLTPTTLLQPPMPALPLPESASQPTVSSPVDDFPYPPQNLPSEDGIPLETNWHRHQMNFLIEIICWHRRDRRDYFAGGNMFIYFSSQQVRNRDFRGPDFFLANDVPNRQDRPYWATWDEGGRGPSLVVELTSPSTREEDFGPKFNVYEKILRVPEYVVYDPDLREIQAWRLTGNRFERIEPDKQGRVFLDEAGLSLGLWHGKHNQYEADWLRFFDADGNLVLTEAEDASARAEMEKNRADSEKALAQEERKRAESQETRAKAATARADAEKARADALADEIARLKAQLQNPA